ncbi:hypothetical protein [Muricomes intestini]|uniref:hypothetical protein n=1 Tax=Muricomes intestini TaxID=1796634 RepID=UPI002FE0BAF7
MEERMLLFTKLMTKHFIWIFLIIHLCEGEFHLSDNHSKEIRSMNMSHIRSTNSKPEEIVRKYLFSRGLRYRKNVRTLPGCPDVVLPKYKTVIFVNGSFCMAGNQ